MFSCNIDSVLYKNETRNNRSFQRLFSNRFVELSTRSGRENCEAVSHRKSFFKIRRLTELELPMSVYSFDVNIDLF